MKFHIVLAAALVAANLLIPQIAIADYTPPNHGGPDDTVGSGTRLQATPCPKKQTRGCSRRNLL